MYFSTSEEGDPLWNSSLAVIDATVGEALAREPQLSLTKSWHSIVCVYPQDLLCCSLLILQHVSCLGPGHCLEALI